MPEDPKEQDRVLAPFRVLAKPLVGCVCKATEFLTDDPKLRIDDDEKEMGVQAWAALFYQLGGRLDARVLVVLWIVSLMLPRMMYIIAKARKKKHEQEVQENLKHEKEVRGEATVVKRQQAE